jgi:hypothetical protein
VPEPDPDHTRILRRAPQAPPSAADDTRTGIIRRAPTGPVPAQPDPRTTHIPTAPEAPTGLIPPVSAPAPLPTAAPPPTVPSPRGAIATSVVAMLSGWAVSVVATDLITGWWETDRLFCLGVGFLAFVFAASTVAGLITVLLRRAVGRYLIANGAVVALLTFGAVFVAGAKIPWPVYLIPVLPVLSVVLAFLPGTRRWTS